ncbi:MAG: thiolase [Hydrogenophaga sp. SCN 70-13]|uniref:Thiolase family protein n=1 Tax=Hydrogenophaga borbori TaxID=2294117 RepID=A0A372EK51_9BURK|nr:MULTISPECIES: thiolase family protein [Hydrogenophaga]MBN9410297.1 thiolase family protein [Burkholderiales bacterium]NCT97937.1 thiolase family protein [Comamonadaceae bacterium]ODT34755.1 MAG: thiolase [Hydrogenophaga sp. SCN 70-13]MBN9371878.1 thiolase family protein [Hydrogenophaga sp.]MBX3609582.1 thiolase family protein [Hydrogenophaga sp.]
MEDIYVVGVGMTPFGRHLNKDIKQLTREATEAALLDAGIRREDLQAAFFGNTSQGHMDGQHMIRGQIALRAMGIGRIPVVNVENACASGSSAFVLACNHVRSGAGEVALAIGSEKMFTADKQKMFSVFDSAWDLSRAGEIRENLMLLGRDVVVPEGSTSPKPYSVFMDVYAAFARSHMRSFGTTQRQLAAVSAKNHAHSVHNPLSQYQVAYSIEDVLGAPPITYPLTLPMCSPVSDGAAAVIVCSRSALQRLGIDTRRAIRVLAALVQSGSDRSEDDHASHCTALAARRAYELAGVGPDDISVAEVHDATAMGEIIQSENLGFCEFGQGGVIAERGDTRIGGRIPINPSGGLESKGHPVGATGLAQVHELVTQLRAEAGTRQVEGARIALAENGGGLEGIEEAVACITILAR